MLHDCIPTWNKHGIGTYKLLNAPTFWYCAIILRYRASSSRLLMLRLIFIARRRLLRCRTTGVIRRWIFGALLRGFLPARRRTITIRETYIRLQAFWQVHIHPNKVKSSIQKMSKLLYAYRTIEYNGNSANLPCQAIYDGSHIF